MKIKISQLSIAPDERIPFHYTIDLSKEEVHFEKPFRQPVIVSGEVFRRAEMVRLTGSIQARIFTRCARCLADVETDKEVTLSFLLATGVDDQDVDDIWVLTSDELDLDEVFVTELLLDMDMATLCQEDCRGLCSQCGGNLNDDGCRCHGEATT